MEMDLEQLLKQEFSANYDDNIKILTDIFSDQHDLISRDFYFHEKSNVKMMCFYIDGLVNTTIIESAIEVFHYKASKLFQNQNQESISFYRNMPEKIKEHILNSHDLKIRKKVQDAVGAILSGNTIFIIEKCNQVLEVSSKGWSERTVTEPQTEQVAIGPRDGFTENLRINTSLVRRRIKDPNLAVKSFEIGKKSKTTINIVYHKKTVKKGLVEEVTKRLNDIQIDGIIDSGYVLEFIEDAPFSPFTTVQSTERPDKVAASILEGRVAVFVDNSPFVLILPTYFWQYLQASDDYYTKYFSGTFYRLIRFFALLISLVLTSIYVMLVSFHQEMIPTGLALTIAAGRDVVPFPVLLEALIMEIAYELIREAGLRMPKTVGQAVSIVGSLVIGQAAVQAGIVSPFMVIIVAITGIASFAIPNYEASFSIRLIRFPLLIASGTFGLLGFSAVLTLILIHAVSLRSFGEAFLAPIAPINPTDQKDVFIRFPWWRMNSQPKLAEGAEDRLGGNQVPQPPNKN